MLPQLIHVLCLFLAVSVPVMALNKTLFSWHPTFMAVGFFGLMAHGVLTALQFRGTEGTKRTNRVSQHMFWQLGSVLFVLGGFAVIETNKVCRPLSAGLLNDSPLLQPTLGNAPMLFHLF